MAKHVSKSLTPALVNLRKRADGTQQPVPLPWKSWVNAVGGGGLFPGLYAFVGGTGIGKTQVILEVLNHAAKLGFPGLYIGLEMGPNDLAARLLGFYSGRAWSEYITGACDPEELEDDIKQHWGRIEALPLLTTFAPPNGWPYRNLIGEVRALVSTYKGEIEGGKTPIIVLDYLQLVDGATQESTRARIRRASYLGKAVAASLGAVVIVVSSTSRSNYAILSGGRNEEGYKPWEDDPNLLVGVGKESGDLEFACDGLFVFVRQARTDNVWVGPAKFRFGRPGWACMHFDGSRMHDGPGGKRVIHNSLQAEDMVLAEMQASEKYSPTLWLKMTGLGGGDAATLPAKLLTEGKIVLADDGMSVVRVPKEEQ